MPDRLRNLSIRQKIIAMVVSTSAVILVVAIGAHGYLSGREMRQTLVESVSALAGAIAVNSTAALAFDDPRSAGEILAALGNAPEVVAARLYARDGETLADYRSPRAEHAELLAKMLREPLSPTINPSADGSPVVVRFHDDHLDIRHAISMAERNLGWLLVQVSLQRIQETYRRAAVASLAIIAASVVLAFLLATFLERLVSRPILNLVRLMQRVSRNQDYSLRARPGSEDELGKLALGFNTMLEQIETQDQALKRAVADLEIARQNAEAASLAKSEFLANMSHEIRTPMNGVLGMAELLAQITTDDRQLVYLQAIHGSGKSLLHIIDDILDFSKIEAGKLTLENVTFDLDELLGETLALFAVQARQKELQLHLRRAEAIPRWLVGDPTRLRQVLSNLLGNAIKFTARGEINLGIEPLATDRQRPQLQFSVSDTGIGIAGDQLASIFDAFMQADRTTTRNFGGTGLGLTVSSQLVRLMGGEMRVSSQTGQGSTFSFTWPFQPSDNASPASISPVAESTPWPVAPVVVAPPQPAPLPRLRGHLLLVEDNDINRTLAHDLLVQTGLRVDLARNGLEAVAARRQRHYDLILMDVQMPVMDGIAATAAIRSLEADGASRTPVIALTANVVAGMREKFLALDLDDYLGKPYTKDQLFAVVGRWLGARAEPPEHDPDHARASR